MRAVLYTKYGPPGVLQPADIRRNTLKLAIAGGAAFWIANFAISLTPIAAEYRAALSISYFPMLLEALAGGLVIGTFVSYFLLRYFDRIPTASPVLKSVVLAFAVLCIIEAFSIFMNLNNASMYFFLLIGAGINVLRFLALGIAIGYLYKR
jgi:hypothetical protein